ncbi:MAG: hypothetical protein KY450_14600 [Actinobacteria bacterium]|nr:hypothetical protein [Actinomycetota bacterium]
MFDFDGTVFADLWQSRSRADLEAYVRYTTFPTTVPYGHSSARHERRGHPPAGL